MMPPHRIGSLFLVGAIALGVLPSHPAAAQPATPAAPAAPASARAQRDAADHDKRGIEAVRRGDAEAARLEFIQSYAVLPVPKTLWNLLLAEIDSNHPLEALKHLKAYLADPNADPKKKEQSKGVLAELNSQVGHVQIGAPEGVSVTLDGVAIGSEQRKDVIDVAPGKHVVEAALKAGPQRRDIDAPAGKETLVTFDAPESETPAPVVAPPPPPAKEIAPAPAPERSRGAWPPPTATWILGGVAVAALGTGVAFSLAAQSKKDELGDGPTGCSTPDSAECTRLRDLDDAGRRNSTIAWIAYGGAGAALVAGGLIWALSPREKHSAKGQTNIAPLAGPGVAGIRLQGSF